MSTQYTIADLRTRLFEAIDGVKSGTVSIDQARTIGELSQVVVNTAKVEIEFARNAERKNVQFVTGEVVSEIRPGLTQVAAGQNNGIRSITQHVLAG